MAMDFLKQITFIIVRVLIGVIALALTGLVVIVLAYLSTLTPFGEAGLILVAIGAITYAIGVAIGDIVGWN